MKKRTHNNLNRNFSKQRDLDTLTVRERSKRMSLIRSKSTKFEKHFIEELKKKTHKVFTTNDAGIFGKPDVVFKKHKVCIFLDSNFWHGWQYSRWKHLLKDDFWREKIERNRKRDKKVTQRLRTEGWTVFRFREHKLKTDQSHCIEKVLDSLK
jgi:DNA mismatch endonuclease Vsr